MSSIPGAGDIQKWAKTLANTSAYAQVLKAMDSTSPFQKLAKSIADNSAYAHILNVLDRTSSAHKLAKSIANNSAYNPMLKVLDSANSFQKLAKSIADNNAYSHILDALDSTSWLQNLTKSVVDKNIYAPYLRALEEGNTFQNIAKSFAAEGAYEKYLKNSISLPDGLLDSVKRLARPEYLDTLIAGIEQDISAQYAGVGGSQVVAVGSSDDAEKLLMQLATAESPSNFSRILEKCPAWLKWLLVCVLLYIPGEIIMGTATEVLGNLITPRIEAYLDGTTASTQREKAKDIKKLSFSELGMELRSYRFITASTLALRAKPNSKAAILGEMRFGQVVGVLSTDRDWTEVVYHYGDGEIITGWVFTRYTAKFRS